MTLYVSPPTGSIAKVFPQALCVLGCLFISGLPGDHQRFRAGPEPRPVDLWDDSNDDGAMCEKEQSIYKHSLLKGPELTRLFIFPEAHFLHHLPFHWPSPHTL